MQPVFIKTSKGYINLNYVSMVQFFGSDSVCVSFHNENEPLWFQDPQEVSLLKSTVGKISLFDITPDNA